MLILGHDTADATLDWQQTISLYGNARIIQVDDGSAAIDAKVSGTIAGGSSTSNSTANILTKAGAGTLAFTAQHSHWGDTIVGAGTLMIGDGSTEIFISTARFYPSGFRLELGTGLVRWDAEKLHLSLEKWVEPPPQLAMKVSPLSLTP